MVTRWERDWRSEFLFLFKWEREKTVLCVLNFSFFPFYFRQIWVNLSWVELAPFVIFCRSRVCLPVRFRSWFVCGSQLVLVDLYVFGTCRACAPAKIALVALSSSVVLSGLGGESLVLFLRSTSFYSVLVCACLISPRACAGVRFLPYGLPSDGKIRSPFLPFSLCRWSCSSWSRQFEF
jgi:hypothetical protein